MVLLRRVVGGDQGYCLSPSPSPIAFSDRATTNNKQLTAAKSPFDVFSGRSASRWHSPVRCHICAVAAAIVTNQPSAVSVAQGCLDFGGGSVE
ncbi:hypothetical protein CBM2634_U250006 [Cupriavidus taiwanensis]|uniref:Uncharacterized protein n=1 Tax=Cupriavidus taiwanensis TaxID=164546 RepID=A0A375JC82_9BURK|nr:hypothetical protein CBM2634_U250006 [Cupriavidus taiwanensis]